MKHDNNLPLVSNNILTLLAHHNKPMTKSEMARELNKTFQTISNNMHPLLARQLVVEHRRQGNAMLFKLGDPSQSLVFIKWRGEDEKLIDVVKSYASGDAPVGNLSPFSKALLKIFSEMFRISADALDNDDPRSITLAQTKEMQATISRMHESLTQLVETCESLLDNPALFDPREIVTELIIKDPSMDHTMARSIAGNIAERLSSK